MDTQVLGVPKKASARTSTQGLDVVRALAQRAGMTVERWQPEEVPGRVLLPEGQWRKTLRINGRDCLVRHIGKLANVCGKDRVILELSLRDLKLAEFLVLYVHVPGHAPRSYVLPAVVAEEVLRSKGKKRARFSIPVSPSSRTPEEAIVWERCRGAWHLLCMN